MYNNDRVSVIVPCYNPDQNLKFSIDSILQQQYHDVDIWVIDDASTKADCDFLEQYISEKKINYIKLTKNGGPAKARNIGLKKSSGRYAAFLDADDLWLPNKLTIQINQMKQKKIALSYSGYAVIDEQDSKIKNIVKVPEKLTYHQLLKNTIMGCLTVIVDRKKVGDFYMPEILGGEDTATWLNIMRKGYVAIGIPQVLAKYRLTPNSFSRNKVKMVVRTWNMYRKTQNLSVLGTAYYFTFYLKNAVLKRMPESKELLEVEMFQ